MIGVKVGYFGYVIGIIYSLYVTTEFILADLCLSFSKTNSASSGVYAIKEREFCVHAKIPQDLFLRLCWQIIYKN